MKKSKVFTFALLALLLSVFSGASSAQTLQDKPNIIYVVTDDLDRDLLMQLPNVGSLLREEGATLTNFNIPQSICCPSRATTLLGEYPHNTGVLSNDNSPTGGEQGFNAHNGPARSIAVNLQGQGYRTALFGKYLNHYNSPSTPQGWTRWFGKHQQRYYDYDVTEGSTIVHYGTKPAHHGDRIIGLETNAFMQARLVSDAPLFVYVSPTAPHAPYQDPPAHTTETPPTPGLYTSKPSFNETDRSDKPAWLASQPALTTQDRADIADRYLHRYRMALEVDDMVADLYATLQAAGELDKTYIVFTSDNGWHNGEHAIVDKKSTPYEEATNVGAVVRGPSIPAGVELDELTSNHDLFATFSDLAGVETPRDGRSLRPLLEGTGAPWRNQMLLEYPNGSNARPAYYGVKTEQYKYVEWGSGEKELYDLEADPHELDNFYPTAPLALIAELQAKLEALKSCAGATCRAAEDA